MPYSVAIIIVSDRAASGEREDQCLPVFYSILPPATFEITQTRIISDDPDQIRAALKELLDQKPRLLFTSGGTGCGVRDNTPEITAELLTKPTPGVDEAIRSFSREKARFAMYSRAVSGLAGDTFVVNLPGSPGAVAEILQFLLPTIEHPLKLVAGQIKDCKDCDDENRNHD